MSTERRDDAMADFELPSEGMLQVPPVQPDVSRADANGATTKLRLEDLLQPVEGVDTSSIVWDDLPTAEEPTDEQPESK